MNSKNVTSAWIAIRYKGTNVTVTLLENNNEAANNPFDLKHSWTLLNSKLC